MSCRWDRLPFRSPSPVSPAHGQFGPRPQKNIEPRNSPYGLLGGCCNIRTHAFQVATGLLALLLLLPLLLSLAPVRRPSPVFEPKECRLFVGKAPDVDPVASRKRLDALLGESDLVG